MYRVFQKLFVDIAKLKSICRKSKSLLIYFSQTVKSTVVSEVSCVLSTKVKSEMCDIVSFMKFVLLCCPEGTYVKDGDRMISFRKERDSRCPPIMYSTESNVDKEAVMVGGVIILMISLLLCFYLYKVYQKFRRNQ